MKNFLAPKIAAIILSLILLISCKGTGTPDQYRISITHMQDFKCDGDLSEWESIEPYRLYANATGQYPEPEDLSAWLRTAWNDEGLLISLDILDDKAVTDTAMPWNADAVEIFLAPSRGSADILQLSFVPAKTNRGEPFVNINDFRETPPLLEIRPVIKSAFTRKNNHTTWEFLVDPHCIGIDPVLSAGMALQVYADDSDDKSTKNKNQVIWYNLGHSYLNSFAMYQVIFTENESSPQSGSSALTITDEEKADLLVFGAEKGDRIRVNRNGKQVLETAASTDQKWKPDTLRFTNKDLDFEKDTVTVWINNGPAGFHDLYISPRLYVRTRQKPFDTEIRNFVMNDRVSSPPADAVLFIGSSSIRKWNTLKKDFPELKIIHRGFGGSTSEEALMYMDKIVLPYHPATIVYYEGDNDIPRGFPAEKIRNNVDKFINRVLENRPDTRIFILSPKPSINRMNYWQKYQAAQKALKDLADEYPSVTYVNVSDPMFDDNGKLKEEIFVSDGIHMNDDGYRIWTRVIRDSLGLDKN